MVQKWFACNGTVLRRRRSGSMYWPTWQHDLFSRTTFDLMFQAGSLRCAGDGARNQGID
jgi:hypothetical protein